MTQRNFKVLERSSRPMCCIENLLLKIATGVKLILLEEEERTSKAVIKGKLFAFQVHVVGYPALITSVFILSNLTFLCVHGSSFPDWLREKKADDERAPSRHLPVTCIFGNSVAGYDLKQNMKITGTSQRSTKPLLLFSRWTTARYHPIIICNKTMQMQTREDRERE